MMNKWDIDKRILLLDGAMGTMLQRKGLTESDFRGNRFVNHTVELKGNNDVLCLTQPEIIADVHRQYLEAGADIIETCSFNSQRISQADYNMCDYVIEMNAAAAKIARKIADEFTQKDPSKKRYVAGSVGPTNKMASMSPDVNRPMLRNVSFDDLVESYIEQMTVLIENGVDALLIETVFDTLNAKAALFAAEEAMDKVGKRVKLMLSATIADTAGRLLSGQTPEALLCSVAHANLFSIGLNCSFGAKDLLPYIKKIAKEASCYVSVHPNAGLPNAFGAYDETPESMATQISAFLKEDLINIAGGCCGTTPEHIAAIAKILPQYRPRIPQPQKKELIISGLDVLKI
ncbi:MAG: homocysteine S-methyltransferase family protein [Paludibacteraceae bacterium]|nr:homocysteine S-methyltransferase family protein [Paludibacteraceae bacterium]